MPELPEVETTRRGIAPLVEGRTIQDIVVRQRRLRWPVPAILKRRLPGARIEAVERRAKYLLLGTSAGGVIFHLGMSGSLRVLPSGTEYHPHDRVAIELNGGHSLRLRDPRRFGAVLWGGQAPRRHRLLRDLGPEPLGPAFTGDYLYQRCRGRRRAIRDLLLDGRLVAGIGNIYANEALFAAGIRPTRAGGRLSRRRCAALAAAIRDVLRRALRAGGTTLKDFAQADGRPGYFSQRLKVYGRAGRPCPACGAPVQALAHGGRRVFYCTNCQL